MSRLEDALSKIAARGGALAEADNELRSVIKHVEDALNDLAPGIETSVPWHSAGLDDRVLTFRKAKARWALFWRARGSADEALLSATRSVRAEVFVKDERGSTAIERLLQAIADQLEEDNVGRAPMIEVARQVSATLSQAGFPRVK